MGKFGLKFLPRIAAVFLLAHTTPSHAQTVGSTDAPGLTVLVRHADRASGEADSPLSPAGLKRADDLAAALRDTKFSAVITTQLIRTRDTARPIASALGIVPEIVTMRPGQAEGHVKAVQEAVRKHAGGIVLVVNHSITLPAIIPALGGPRIAPICESVYDDLFTLVPASGMIQFIRSRYGVPTPPGPECPLMEGAPAR